jgi:hypothetical protein
LFGDSQREKAMQRTNREISVGRSLLGTSLIAVSLALLIVGCVKSGGGSSNSSLIVGDEFHFPAKSVIAREYQAENLDPPVYTRFDQVYPPGWPSGFKFPKDTFILEPPLELKPVRNEDMAAAGYKEYHAQMIIPFDTEEATSFLVEKAQAAGFSTESQSIGQVVDIVLMQGSDYRGLFKLHPDSCINGFTQVSVSILE